MKKILLTAALLQAIVYTVGAQEKTNPTVLAATAKQHREKEGKKLSEALRLAKEKGWETSFRTSNGNIAFLVDVDPFGYPVYTVTENNTTAAATTRANVLWPGGSSGLNLTGSGTNLRNKIGIWDGGRVLDTHVELANRVTQRDNPSGNSDHATHVAGTMVATGVNPLAKGMSFGAEGLVAYDFANDGSEMSGEAASLLLSNHSYGAISGWRYNESSARWEFWGRFGENEDYKFGYYDERAQLFDSLAYNAPYYLIVKSAGNNRNENGPGEGANYWRYNASGVMSNAGTRPPGIYGNDGYDIISTYGNAKNILTVGAVNGLPYGYSKKEDVVLSSFTSFGPTDDGRIKPDVVANGVDLLSPVASNASAYASFSGTSMATPNTTGSLFLLQQYYAQRNNGDFMRSATLKALTIHTADEAGDHPGPDYRFGWGLVNVGQAAEVIRAHNSGNHRLMENTLTSGASYTTTVIASGNGRLSATIAWTDPKGEVETSNVLDNPAKKLVNDLDIRITKGTTTFFPWKMNPVVPEAAATKGDNDIDNVERIDIEDAIPGQTYTITITHKGTLARGSQAYSLVLSGVGGAAYCASGASATDGARIENVTFGNINRNNPAGCTSYTDNTNLSTVVEPGQSVPLSVTLGSCDATAAAKIVKVFIDFNNNGSFNDANELVATSNVINGNGTFSANVTIPGTVTVGNTTLMRVVAVQTNDAATVAACGTYANGETQDYRVGFKAASNDLAVIEMVSPMASTLCANPAQTVAVRFRNTGVLPKANIPLTAILKQGNTTVATLTGVSPTLMLPGEISSYTFQNTFATTAGTTYTLELIASDGTDQNKGNDTLPTTLAIPAAPAAPVGTGVICGSNALLRVTNPVAGTNYFWYNSSTSTTPIANGASVNTTTMAANNTYSVSTGFSGTAGPANNALWGQGGGYLSGSANYITYNATVPVILESAKLYTKTAGKIDLIVADITSQTGTGYTYSTISSTTIDVYATSPNQATGTVASFDPQDNGAQFSMNVVLPAGEHVLIIRPQGNANLFRNNNVTGNPYPFTVGGVISFTGNSVQAPTDFQGFWYYLYNMKIRTADCQSAKGTVVAANVPTPTVSFVNDSLVSSADAGNQWYLNGVGIFGATDKKYKPTQSGNYSVQVAQSGCVRTSTDFAFVVNSINPIDNASIGLSASPNPSKGNFVLKFRTSQREDLTVSMINAQGQQVYAKSYPKFTGTFNEQMALEGLAAGVYVLKVQHGDKTYFTKVMIEK